MATRLRTLRPHALLTACAALALVAQAPAQQHSADAGCALQRGIYTCNWALFKAAFDAAHTIQVQTHRMDRQAETQLQHLISDMGKQPSTADTPANLTMLLIPVDSTGVSFGPADHDIATLRIYAPAGSEARGTLVWAETFRGQDDRPWPSVVHALLQQFRDRFQQNAKPR